MSYSPALRLSNLLIGPLVAVVVLRFAALGEPVSSPVAPEPREASCAIQLHFRGAPLDSVLDHLSKAAGFAIVKEADVQGTVDVWSHQSLNREEAVELLNTVLEGKGLAAVRTGRTLRIVPRGRAATHDLPVRTGADPSAIPRSEAMVTQVMSVRYADAAKLVENLQMLLPEDAKLSANESSNVLILTASQTTIRRIAAVIQALDTSIATVSEIKVYALDNADAEELAEVVNNVFERPSENNGDGSERMRQFFTRMRGRRGGDDNGSSDPASNRVTAQVRAVADARSNSLVVSAPADLLGAIDRLVRQVDLPTEDLRQLQVFPLRYASAEEIADSINELFTEDETDQGNGTAGRRFPGMRGRRGVENASSSDASSRSLAEAAVTAVPDSRTNSVLVTASERSLAMIAGMIEKLDEDPKNVAQVYLYRIRYADLDTLRELLDGMFEDFDENAAASTGTTRETRVTRR